MSTTGSVGALRRIARLDLSAFAANARAVLESGDDPVFDARADAYGHGANLLVPLALELGFTTVRVSPANGTPGGVRRSALMTVPSARRRLVGAEVYGLAPHSRPVLTLVGEVIAVKRVPAGSPVSYGYTYRTTSDATLALVALGYADGIPRLASNRARLSLGGALLPLVGRVAMDQLVIDCGDHPASVGDEVVAFGDAAHGHPTALDWAEHTERSPLELTAGLGWRVARIAS